MAAYLIRRLMGLVPLLFGITLICFVVIRLTPGEPTSGAMELNPKISVEARQRIMQIYGLNDPLHVQYLRWLGRVARLDFGRSIKDNRPVNEKIAERIPVTLTLNVLAMALVLAVSLPMGVLAAARPYGRFDQFTTVLVFIGYSTPTFWLALLLMRWLGVQLQWLPVCGLHSLGGETWPWGAQVGDVGRHLLLPVGLAAFGGLAGLARYMRGSMIEALRQDYIRTARAKGLPERAVLFRHALRNALLPVITILGLSVPGLLGGSVIFETIFSIPGLGRLYYDAVMARDLTTVMGLLTISAFLTLLGNLIADVAYAYADPRIRIEAEGPA
ncbi:MAG: ABC transporter permease [Candidatus Omnitrophica bacterium]|nr:ABC transporter permease [Candidatus Omnitrophota bacterium]